MILIAVVLCIIQTVQSDSHVETMQYKRKCMEEIKLDKSIAQPLNSNNSRELQRRNFQCLERCIMMKRGIIDQQEILQENVLKQQYPYINLTSDIDRNCPEISNLTDKCEKAIAINRCIENLKWLQMRYSRLQLLEYKNQCIEEISKKNSANTTRYEMQYNGEWCVERCILIKRGILDENNAIKKENPELRRFGDFDLSTCASIKDDDKCREAVKINLCINRSLLLKH